MSDDQSMPLGCRPGRAQQAARLVRTGWRWRCWLAIGPKPKCAGLTSSCHGMASGSCAWTRSPKKWRFRSRSAGRRGIAAAGENASPSLGRGALHSACAVLRSRKKEHVGQHAPRSCWSPMGSYHRQQAYALYQDPFPVSRTNRPTRPIARVG